MPRDANSTKHQQGSAEKASEVAHRRSLYRPSVQSAHSFLPTNYYSTMAASPSFNFVPAPEEQAYYAALFQAADTTRSGALAGKEAVTFLATSGVPMDTLKNIWTMVDTNPKTSSLDPRKFNNAVRLIQLHQNGQRPTDASLSCPPGVSLRPPMFEGISGMSIPLPGAGGPPAAAQQPPAQLQQQPPPMQQQQQQQQQQQAPPTPQPYGNQQPPQPQPEPQPSADPSSTALAAQDPYVAYPQELSRYDVLFPQYAKDDGYIYGAEAVALFSKSGADKAALRSIWTMVDTDPVDNRLDQLEFALAMHLIVCVTKKGLPVPPALPPSLKALKDQQAGGGGGNAGAGPQGLGQGGQQQPPVPPSPARTVQTIPSPSMQGQQMPSGPGQQMMGQQMMGQGPPPMMPGMGIPPPADQQGGQMQMQQMQQPQMQGVPAVASMGSGMGGSMAGPPPLAAPGGASISDAFEGLAPAGGPSMSSVGGGASVTGGASYTAGGGGASYTAGAYNAPPSPKAEAPPAVVVPNVQQPQPEPLAVPTPHVEVPPPAPAAPGAENIPAPTPVAANRSAPTVAHDSRGELATLQATLQKLQAENISLKAKLGDVSEEEAEVRKEIGTTVAEIGRLSQELTGLREKVADAKTALIEATAELKAQKEKKGMVTDLIDDTNQTLDALNDARGSMQDLHATDARIEQQQQERNAAGNAFESGLFEGFGDAPAPAPAVAAEPAQAPVPEPEVPAPAPVAAEPAPAPAPVEQHAAPDYMRASAPEYGGVMGGAVSAVAYEQPAMAPMGGTSMTSAPSALNPDSFGHNSSMGGISQSLSAEEIDAIKQQVTELDRKAVAAEDSQRQLMAQAEALRQEAEQAELAAAEKASAAEGKKKKKFGGGKKGAVKDADAARAEALQKKQAAEAAQTALSNAQAEAISAKRQADELRMKAEEAELQAASEASMQQQQQQAAPVPPAAPAVPQMDMGGYAGYAAALPPMGGMPENKPMDGGMANGHGMMGGAPAPTQEYQYQQQPMGVMGGGAPMGGMPAPDQMNGGGGPGIPTPEVSQNDDYSNPFGGW